MAEKSRSGVTTVGDSAAAAVGRAAARVAALGLDVDPTSVHDARKAIRRLRAALHTYRPLLDVAAADELVEHLKAVAQRLGAVRDLDVLGDRLATRAHDLDADLTPWTVALCWERARARESLRDHHASPAHAALVGDVRRWADDPAFRDDAPLDGAAARFLTKRVRRRADRLSADLDTADADADTTALHDVRKRAKQARYTMEVAAPVLGKRPRATARELQRLTTTLGDLQDTVVTREWLDGTGARQAGGEVERGMMIGFEAAAERRAREQIPERIAAARRSLRRALP